MEVSINQLYTSAACNRCPEIADWNSDAEICFGASNAVVIYNTKIKDRDPLTVLCHHKSRVNSVKWIRKSDGSSKEFISCSADNTANIWSLVDGCWKLTSCLTGHTNGVTSGHGSYTDGDNLIIFTASVDSTVKVWEIINGSTELKQTINLNNGLCLTLHSHLLPNTKRCILFCAMDDHKIHVFAGEHFQRVHTLQGHEDWVRGLDVMDVDGNKLLVASASQDTYIRLWRIERHVAQEASSEIRVELKLFEAYGEQWAVKLDAVLAAHEGWVYGVQWHPSTFDAASNSRRPVYRLLSSSLDKTLIVWELEEGAGDGGAWLERVRVGEVGGNSLGFYGGRFGPGGKSILGHGYNGSFHIWNLNKETNQWEPSVVCGGHFDAVKDVSWEPTAGSYIVSVSKDQTTRLHAPWKRDDGSSAWHELARPQVHGYDMAAIAPVTGATFASAAEEKVIRVFEAPHNFLSNFANITRHHLSDCTQTKGPQGASVPSLGLSNKAVFNGDESKDSDDNDGYFVPMDLTEPPTEESLMQQTLWPERCKLYAHGSEVFALAASRDRRLLASACSAASEEHAAVVLWDAASWTQAQRLAAHRLTVTQLAFSPDSRLLLSVSRDRRWTLFRRRPGSDEFELHASTDRTNGVHARIVWCCAWADDGQVFATGSRDGKVCVWSKSETVTQTSLKDYALLNKPLEVKDASVTALAFAPVALSSGARIVCAGFESGAVQVYRFQDQGEWTLLKEMVNGSAHHLTVKRLAFRPQSTAKEGEEMLLASAGNDHFVRIWSVIVGK